MHREKERHTQTCIEKNRDTDMHREKERDRCIKRAMHAERDT